LLTKYSIEPPSNIESEQDFLKGLLEHQSIIESISISDEIRNIFYSEIGKIVYDTILELYKKNALTINTLIITLQKTGHRKKAQETYPKLLFDAQFISLDALKLSFRLLFDLHNQRTALSTILGSFDDLENGNIDSIVCRIESLIIDLKKGDIDTVDYGIINHSKNAEQEIFRMLENPLGLFPHSGLRKVNEFVPYFYPDDVIIIGGRPGMGKTITGVKHTIEVALQGFPVGYVSLEMSATSLIKRMYSAYSKIPYKRLKEGKVYDNEIDILKKSIATVNKLPIYFYDRPERDMKDLKKWFRIMAKEKGVKLFVIDYVQLIEYEGISKENEYAIVTNVSKDLKKLNRELGIPIILLAQLNRGGENNSNKIPTMKEIRGSGQLEQDASVIVLLDRSDEYGFREARLNKTFYEAENTIEYHILKSRDGGTGSVLLHCEAAYNIINDL